MIQRERDEHIKIYNWFITSFPQFKEDLHHFANERKCTPWQGKLLRKMGVTRGVSDFFLGVPKNGKHGLWIELKVGKNKPTPEQLAFASRKIERGYAAVFVWGFEQARDAFLDYLSDFSVPRHEDELFI